MAAGSIADRVHELQLSRPDARAIVLGDMKQCRLETVLPWFQQYVRDHTRAVPEYPFIGDSLLPASYSADVFLLALASAYFLMLVFLFFFSDNFEQRLLDINLSLGQLFFVNR